MFIFQKQIAIILVFYLICKCTHIHFDIKTVLCSIEMFVFNKSLIIIIIIICKNKQQLNFDFAVHF